MNHTEDMGREAVSLASALIQIPSLTAILPDLSGSAAAPLTYLQNVLEQGGAICQRLTFEGGHPKWGYAVDNLFAEWDGDEALGHICFLGHTDVVSPGDTASWSFDPFSGACRDGFLLGRGATDMKGAVAAFCTAAIHTIRNMPISRPKISLVITADEEWAAINGTCKVLEWMRASGRNPTAFLVGEPSSMSTFGSHIKIGRRGSLCGTIIARGIQGHAAYPALFKNPNPVLVLALTLLHTLRWDDAMQGMPATAFETIALHAGNFSATAIVPDEAAALWNIRFTPQQKPQELLALIVNKLENKADWTKDHPNSADLQRVTIIGNTDTVSMPYYSAPDHFADLVSTCVTSHIGAIPTFDASGGTTDARFIHPVFPDAQIVELGLPENGGGDGLRGGMHQIDERCSISDLVLLTRCYGSVLQRFEKSAA